MSVFFSEVKSSWNDYSHLRTKYTNLIPIPNPSYFQPIHDITHFTNLLVRPIHSPLWLGVNALLLFLKSFIYLAATALLLVPALLLAVFAPKSRLSPNTCSSFQKAAANTVVDATMGIIATCATLASIVFNPIYLLTRCLSTVVKHLSDVTESCCGFPIARFN
ncbi:hypothetical protein DGG96_13155 [Legionella qingyii]|uniref:Uncharacterized protein n=1 Tax=Legionella qingyii TaxID=2184757 RepID=A0A317U1M1_9GAMM|nr:hypothetical protein [Legionella qingyii]PWY55125.1 hypothetical protein DGG96_13155 [Legionella qingyii]RUR25452.1 hypothetical protein ELY20_03060 [Legionella qingyii]RUR28438.1 hypothetical protein ELY16_02950 [Legionella qingyii]